MRNTFFSWWGLLFITGCGGNVVAGSGGGAPGAGGAGGWSAAEAEAACEEHSTAVCAKETECIPGRPVVIGPPATCAERMKTRCLSRFGLGHSGLTPALLLDCAAAMSASGCGMFTMFPDACKIAGTQAEGLPCADDAQCASSVCDHPFGALCGACAPAGASHPFCIDDCSTSPSECSFEGTTCPYSKICNAGLCYPGPAEGEKCGSFPLQCTYPAACDGTCTLELPPSCGQ